MEKLTKGNEQPIVEELKGDTNFMIIELESKRQIYEKMETPEGMREVVAGTCWGKGEAKCRCCGEVVAYDVSDPKVSVSAVTVNPTGSHLNSKPKSRHGFAFSMKCPSSDGRINLGDFYSSIGLGNGNPGDRYTSTGRVKGYTSELVSAYRAVGEANSKTRTIGSGGIGFLDKR